MCRKRVKEFIDSIKKGLHSVIPEKLLRIFEPHEMEMILYGVPFIDIEDWEKNTEYQGAYHLNHKNIYWFWEFVKAQPQ